MKRHCPTDTLPPAKRARSALAPSILDALVDDVLCVLYRSHMDMPGRTVLRLTHRIFATFVAPGDAKGPLPPSTWARWFGLYRDFASDGWPAYPKVNMWRGRPHDLWDGAIYRNRVTTLEWLCGEDWPRFPDEILYEAVRHDRVPVLDWLLSAQLIPSLFIRGAHLMNNAVLDGHLTVMQWIRAHAEPGPWYDDRTMRFAARTGRLDMMEWLVEQGCAVNADTFRFVLWSEADHRPVLKWLLERLGWAARRSSVMLWALASHNLVNAQWLYEHGFPLPGVIHRGVCGPAAATWLESMGYVFP